MRLAELTDLEAKTIYLIHHRINYHDTEQLKQICDMLEHKKLLHSDSAKEYENGLKRCVANPSAAFVSCISCGNDFHEGEAFLCSACLEQLKQRLKVVTIERSEKKVPEISQKQFRVRWPAVIIACALLLLAAVLCIMAVVQKQSVTQKTACQEEQFVAAYDDNLTKQGFDLGEGQPYEQNSTLYPILTKEEQKANNSLITFYDTNRKLEGAALQMNGSDEESRVRQLRLMALAVVTMYDKMTIETAGHLLEQMLNQNGQLDYDGYKWIMTTDHTGTTFLMIDASLAELSEGSADASFMLPEGDQELLYLLGNSYDEAKKLLGESETVITENTRYFRNACVSLIYDTESDTIIYIDCDGLGEQLYTICGIQYGMQKEEVLTVLKNAGVQEPTGQTEDTLVFFFSSGKENVELSVTFLDDRAGLICCKLLDQ